MYAAVLKAEGSCSRVHAARAALREGDGHDTGFCCGYTSCQEAPGKALETQLAIFFGVTSPSGSPSETHSNTAVHSNDQMTEADKSNYLKSLLTATAYEANTGHTLSASNYKEAVAILEGKFGNQYQIIAKHMDQLLNMIPLTLSSNLQSL